MWRYLFISGLIYLFVACRKNEVYYSFREINKSEWSKSDTLYFYVDTITTGKGAQYNITVELGHNANYPYRNLWLYISDNINDSVFMVNTFQYMLADEFGKWYGSGFGANYQYSLPYKENVRFSGNHNCLFKVVHGMRDEPLYGIDKIGIKIERAD